MGACDHGSYEHDCYDSLPKYFLIKILQSVFLCG